MKIVSKKSPWYNHCCPYTKLWSVKKNSKSNHEKNTENWDYKNFEKLPWISNISPKIKRVIKKRERYYLHVGKKSTRNSLTKKPPKLPPDSQLGLYPLDCLCNEKYIGESKKRVLKQCIVHQQDSISRKWVSPGAAEHRKEWHEQFYWLHPKTVRISRYMCERKIWNEILRSAPNKKLKNN